MMPNGVDFSFVSCDTLGQAYLLLESTGAKKVSIVWLSSTKPA